MGKSSKDRNTNKNSFFRDNILISLLILFALLLLIIFPMILPSLLKKELFDNVVGENDTWIGFWGSYISTIGGALLTITLTFLILKYQLNRDEADKEVNSRPNFSVQEFHEENIENRKSRRSFGEGLTKLVITDGYKELIRSAGTSGEKPNYFITILCEYIPAGCSNFKINCIIAKDETFMEKSTIELNWDVIKTGDELVIPACSLELDKANAIIEKTNIEVSIRTGDIMFFEFNFHKKKTIIRSNKFGVLLKTDIPSVRYQVLK
ncbi:hypothetical protein E3Z46_13850 [Listeria monocytogenes]|uniref:hypothetical protein n=1 Tax=Listeria TaxID=1637 RepID=UPI0008748B36|nr:MULTISPECIES: hypothetical protein [Listeria]EAC3359106.1 hypothetical protein [Listeria monocytogenes]EAD9142348.1 hypothetical protein [Listeria monocytogenes]EAE5924535.1 hypothetical protein [Listeria monocytogenes]EAE5997106.1 hypothetical protein [Listeria monocytogenes]EAF1515830.1 hypothetical protein [Listeria monocytogenes]